MIAAGVLPARKSEDRVVEDMRLVAESAVELDGKIWFRGETVCRALGLRAQTMRGPRVTLASSEMLEDPWSVEFDIVRIPNTGTAKSNALSWDEIELALSYGEYHGFCQWRNAGYGQFRWDRLDV